MYIQCPICGSSYQKLILNHLPMRQCIGCGLVWREQFDFEDGYYKEGKDECRILNSRHRANKFKKIVDLNNLCDIGTGEGSFLKVLTEYGYKNVLGIEPNAENYQLIKDNNLKVISGNIDNIKKIIQDHDIHTVSMFNLIEHLSDPLGDLRLIFEAMEKGDRLVIETPDFDSYIFKKINYKHQSISKVHLFYFGGKNLRRIVAAAGFNILATGKTDFNPNSLGIRESLFRLGLINKNIDSVNKKSGQSDGALVTKNFSGNIFIIIKELTKKVIRKLLNSLVIISGRLEYIWLVAEK